MNNIFWIDKKRNLTISYEKLIEEINNIKEFNKYVLSDNPYQIFLNIILGIINNRNIILLDSDFSENEIFSMGLQWENINEEKYINNESIETLDELILKINEYKNDFKLTLYTSGTTGKPKKINHSMDSLTRQVKINDNMKDDVWAFAYNPTHFAGLQVFFQAFLNLNKIIYIFDIDKNEVEESLRHNNVTRISATPTFYKSIIPFLNEKIITLKSVTSGGEKFDINLIKKFNEIFPNAKIYNIYASTEAGSLFSGKGDLFKIDEKLIEKIIISEENELLIHKDLLGESDDLTINNNFYNTGDIVELVDKNTFKFVSRNTEFINVGGYRVNPTEVEMCINELDLIRDSVVYGKPNSVTGNIVVVEIVKNDNYISDIELKKALKIHCDSKLQKWKVPRIINIVEDIQKTRTGKKVRRK